MPADSERAGVPSLPRTYRPLGPRIVATVLVAGLAIVCAMAWIGFDDATRAKFTVFQKLTMAFFALAILVCVHALTRSRVTARTDRLVVVNGYRRRELAWAQVVAVRVPPRAPGGRPEPAGGAPGPPM